MCPPERHKRAVRMVAEVRDDYPTETAAQVKALKKEIAEPKRANGIRKAASAFSAAELDRPHTRS